MCAAVRDAGWAIVMIITQSSSAVLQVTLLAGLQRYSFRSGAACVQGIVGSMPWNAMVFITLWLQLLGFSDFAASLLMALFALGSALGGLLGGAIGAPSYYTHIWADPTIPQSLAQPNGPACHAFLPSHAVILQRAALRACHRTSLSRER